MDGTAPYRRHALNEENGRKAPPGDLIRDVPLIVLDADGGQLLCQVGIAQVPPLQFGLEDALHESLPIPAFGRHWPHPIR